MITIPDGEPPLSYLAYTLPPRASDVDPEEILDRFLDFVRAQGLELYKAQEEAILELMGSANVILNTPTGSGKSLVAAALHFHALVIQQRSFYTAPIKALVNEKFFALCRDFGPHNVGMMTGDATVNRDAPIICCTAEILANAALREGAGLDVQQIVMDEFHYYADRDRGVAWQIPLLTLSSARFLLMSATFGDAQVFEERLTKLNGRPTATVRSTHRPVPLDFSYRVTLLHETLLHLVADKRVPIYVVNFTQKACAEVAQNLMSHDYCTKEEKRAIAEVLRGVRFDSRYGKDVQRYLRHGIGIHHAGLLPKYRLLVEKLAQRGYLKIIVGTDTLGVGINIPIRTVVFTKLCKYDGNKTSLLSARDFHQIAGRAGRKGFDELGSVVVQAPEHVVENLYLEQKAAASSGKKRKVVRKQPPTKGYVHWDRATFDRLVAAQPEPLESRFRVSHGMLVNVLQRGPGGCRAMARIIHDCHESRGSKKHHARNAAAMFQSLVDAELLEVTPDKQVLLREDLQAEFSLFQALSLYLVEAAELLDDEDPEYALNLLSLVEAILENPELILYKQLDRLKFKKLAELKAAGVEYEERMAELEKVELPRPNAEFVYQTFGEFSRRHPWVTTENTHLKSIAREMYEGFYSFADYVREYGLERSEGLLLRYLSEVYKTLVQTVPSSARTEEVDEIIAYFGAIVRAVDSSLLDEWERLAFGTETPKVQVEGDSVATDADRVDVTRDPRRFEVLLRNTLFSVVRALSRHEYAAATELIEDGEESWTPSKLEQALAPYFTEHHTLRIDPAARVPKNTRILDRAGPVWRVEQILCDPEDHNEWVLCCRVDIARSRDAGRPVVLLDRLGS